MEEERQRLEAEKNKYSPINVNEMYSAYKSNPARAHREYSGRYVKIMGSVVGTIESGADVVTTGVIQGNEYYSMVDSFINCYPKTEEAKSAIYNISMNQRIVVYGKIKKVGDLMGYYVDVDRFEW